jgi:hypothetical protein
VPKHGDILKQVTVRGKGFTGYTVTLGGQEILKEKVNGCDTLDITFGKIGLILLRLPFDEVSILIYSDTIDGGRL